MLPPVQMYSKYNVNKGFLSDHRARAISSLGAKDNRYYHWPRRSNY